MWAQDDKEKFDRVNFNWRIVQTLSERAGIARYAEVLWKNLRLSQKDAQKIWEQERGIGYELRDDILYAMDYAFDGEEDLIQRLDEIQEGDSHIDMIMDLTAISALGRENKKLLEEINYPMEKIEEAAKFADRLSNLMAKAGADQLEKSEEKKIRDKAYTYLYLAVRKVRKCGKYVFRGDKDRLKGYISEHTRRLSRKSRNRKLEDTIEETME